MVRGAFSALSVLIVQPSNTPSEVSKVDLHSHYADLRAEGGDSNRITVSACGRARGRPLSEAGSR